MTFALTGLGAAWLTYYYGYLFLGFEVNTVFLGVAGLGLAYIYMWWTTASSTSQLEYHEYEVRGLAPPYLHAVPGSGVISPLRAARWSSTPIVIRVTRGG